MKKRDGLTDTAISIEQRLRNNADFLPAVHYMVPMLREAADRIKGLEAERDRLQTQYTNADRERTELKQQVSRLRNRGDTHQ